MAYESMWQHLNSPESIWGHLTAYGIISKDLRGFACKMLTGVHGRARHNLAQHSANDASTHPQRQKACGATTFERIWGDLKGFESV